jgi:peptidoglycan hydrolase-like protein with peptidoglycan-binding domain
VYPDGRVVYLDTASTSMSTSTSAVSGPVIAHNHQLYDTSPDIKALQQFLNSHGFMVATSGLGSPGNETDFFGTKTYQALVKFQQAQGLPATSRPPNIANSSPRALLARQRTVATCRDTMRPRCGNGTSNSRALIARERKESSAKMGSPFGC